MKKKWLIISIILFVVGVGTTLLLVQSHDGEKDDGSKTKNSGYAECVNAGNPIALSDPPQCHDSKGTHYGP